MVVELEADARGLQTKVTVYLRLRADLLTVCPSCVGSYRLYTVVNTVCLKSPQRNPESAFWHHGNLSRLIVLVLMCSLALHSSDRDAGDPSSDSKQTEAEAMEARVDQSVVRNPARLMSRTNKTSAQVWRMRRFERLLETLSA